MKGKEQPNLTEVAAGISLSQLTDDELAVFNNILGWESGDARKMCENKPWFSKVESLFN